MLMLFIIISNILKHDQHIIQESNKGVNLNHNDKANFQFY